MLKNRGVVLQLRCPHSVDGISVEPEPNWNFNTLLSEIDALEKKLTVSSKFPLPFTKTASRDVHNGKSLERKSRAFIMRVPEHDLDDTEDDSEGESRKSLIVGKRFACDDIYLSDESDDESLLEDGSNLMSGVELVEGAMHEISYEHQLAVKEEIRSQVSAFETEIMNEMKTSTSAFSNIEKYREERLVEDRKFDFLYQRKIAEALDNHLTAIQREHEHKSQIEERKIRNDAAHEEAKRREKSLQEEKLRQEKARKEAEMQAKLRAEEEKGAALEAEKRAAKEAAERKAAEALKKALENGSGSETKGAQVAGGPGAARAQAEGSLMNVLRAAESALNLEQQRLKKLEELDEKNLSLRSISNDDFTKHERHISRLIRQISGTKDNVSTKAREIIKIFGNPSCPQSVSIATFAKKIVSSCENPNNPPFACGYVIVLVTSQFPQAMDILLAEFHKACIFTVPKHMAYSEAVFGSREAYRKALGFQELDGKIESMENYLKRVESCMKLYGALVQTEIDGVKNFHGLQNGWAWLARFLNKIPPTRYTAVALSAFLRTAGYALYRRYKLQFVKILNTMRDHFLSKLKSKQDQELAPITMEIQSYLDDKKYLEEPEGRSLQSNLLSRELVPSELDYQGSYDNYNYYYQGSYDNYNYY